MGEQQIVLDTNVLISGLLSPHGAPAQVLNLVINGEVILLLDSRIFHEYESVMKRKKFSFPKDAIEEIVAFIQKEGVFVSPGPLVLSIPDIGDLPFIEVATYAQVPIVTGNVRHYGQCRAEVLTPKMFIESLQHDKRL
jgi:putative PIN family toxin of toxin-antitoxin system